VVRELAVSKEILNRRLSGFGALVGRDILRMALSIVRSWICSNKSTSNNSHPSLFIQADAECLGLKPIFDKVTCQFALRFSPIL
jgi:hypothetical protein